MTPMYDDADFMSPYVRYNARQAAKGRSPLPDPDLVRKRERENGPEPGSVCPTCDRRVPVPKEDRTPRKREQLNVAVPADAENGREALVTLIDAARERLREPLGYDHDTPPYFVLTAVLADWLGGR